jgi:hypothetical protein
VNIRWLKAALPYRGVVYTRARQGNGVANADGER